MRDASPTRGQRQLQRKKRSAETVRLAARAGRKRRDRVTAEARSGVGGGTDEMRGFFPFPSFRVRMTT
jgi:hypothetical protein